jgi:hypothetical protein
LPNGTFLIIVKIQPIKVTVHLVYIELEFFVKKINVSDSNQLIVFLQELGTGITSPVSEQVAACWFYGYMWKVYVRALASQ